MDHSACTAAAVVARTVPQVAVRQHYTPGRALCVDLARNIGKSVHERGSLNVNQLVSWCLVRPRLPMRPRD